MDEHKLIKRNCCGARKIKKFSFCLLILLLLSTQQINLTAFFFNDDNEPQAIIMAPHTSEIDGFSEMFANRHSIINPNGSSHQNSEKTTSLTPTSRSNLENSSTNVDIITSNLIPLNLSKEQTDAVHYSYTKPLNLQLNSSLKSKDIENQFNEITPSILFDNTGDRPDIEFIQPPGDILVEYTGEDIIIPLEWFAVSNTIQYPAVRKFILLYYDGSKFPPGTPITIDQFEVLAGDSSLTDSFENPPQIADPSTKFNTGVTNEFISTTWGPGEPLRLNFIYDHNSVVVFGMIFVQIYVDFEVQYGPFGIPIGASPVPKINQEITVTKIFSYDDTIPKFSDMPEFGEVQSTETYRALCPDQFPIVKSSIEEILSSAEIEQNEEGFGSSEEEIRTCPIDLDFNKLNPVFIEQGSKPLVLSYTPTDLLPDTYEISKYDARGFRILQTGKWESGKQINYIVNGETVENFALVVIFRDTSQNFVAHISAITVEKAAPPDILFRQTTPSLEDKFSSSTFQNLFQNTVNNAHNNINTTTTNPDEFSNCPQTTILGPNALVIYEPEIFMNYRLEWVVDEVSPTTYTILKNGVIVPGYENKTYNGASFNTTILDSIERAADGSFTYNNSLYLLGNGPYIFLNESGELLLDKGYNFTVIVYDKIGNVSVDQTCVIKADYSKPRVLGQGEYVFQDETLAGYSLTWIAEDENPTNYTLYLNNIVIEEHNNKPWVSGQPVIYQLPDLLEGVYTYDIEFFDQAGNLERFTSVVINVDSVPVINPDRNSTYSLGSTGNKLSWVAGAGNPATYVVMRGGLTVQTGTWSNGERIEVDVDGHGTGNYSYTITIYDEYGRYVIGNSTVTVFDIITPILLIVPIDKIIEYGSIGNFISLVAEDLEPQNYSIVLTDLTGMQLLQTGTWRNNEAITYSLDNFELGERLITWYFSDKSGNTVAVPITVRVVDTTSPQIITAPSDVILEYTGSLQQINLTWEVDDYFLDSYRFYRNDVIFLSGEIMSDGKVSLLLNESQRTIHRFSISFQDTLGNQVWDMVVVNIVDTQVPDVSDTVGYAYQHMHTGNEILWTIHEFEPSYYIILHNGTTIYENTYQNDIAILRSIDGLALGTHNFTIIASDKTGLVGTDVVLIIVEDTEPPFITERPDDIIYEFGSIGYVFVWRATDSLPANYSIYQNSSKITENSWQVNEQISLKVDGLAVGFYIYEIRIFEESGSFTSDIVTVTVIDTTRPFIEFLNDMNIEFASTGNQLIWEVSDHHPGVYEVRRDGVVVNSGSWEFKENIITTIDGLPIQDAYYEYNLTVWDVYQNSASRSLRVLVEDTIAPEIITKPDGFSYELANTNLSIVWVATDLHPSGYTIERNGELVYKTNWLSNQRLEYSIDETLTVGDYEYEISIYDQYGNKVTHIVSTKISDTAVPLLVVLPNDFTYEFASTGNTITWSAIDSAPSTYNITKDGVLIVDSIVWISGESIIRSIDGNSVGNYSYNITLLDGSGNIAFDEITVEVIDTTIPTLGSPVDVSYEEGRLGNTIQWSVFDYHPGTYQVFRDGNIPIDSGTWVNAQNYIQFFVDNLKAGKYKYTIELSDAYGNIVRDEVEVAVQDSQAPILIIVQNATYEYGNAGNTITWTGIDYNPGVYDIYAEGNKFITTGRWDNNNIQVLQVDGLDIGTHFYQIYVYDSEENVVNKTVSVTVRDTTYPVIQSPSSFEMEYRVPTQNKFWIVTDLRPDKYIITLDGIQIESGTWTSNQSIYIVVPTSITVGVHVFELLVYDKSNLLTQSQVVLRVIDSINPELTTESDLIIEYGSPEVYTLNWVATDLSEMGTYKLSLNDTIFGSEKAWVSGEAITYSFTGLNLGLYNFKITLVDVNLNSASQTVKVVVEDTINPRIEGSLTQTFELGNAGAIIWTAYDIAPSYYQLYKDGVFIKVANWTSGEQISIELLSTEQGFTIYTFKAYDTSGNQNSTRTTVQVFDETAPVITVTANNLENSVDSHQAGVIGSSISWTAFDHNPGTFILRKNQTIIAEGTWNNQEAITYELTSLELGAHLFEIEFADGASNKAVNETTIVIIDTKAPGISSSGNLTLELSNTDYEIKWIVTDAHPKNYTVFENNSMIMEGTYVNGQEIVVQRQITSISVTTYQLFIDDLIQNRANDTVVITIEEPIPPIIILELVDTVVELGETPAVAMTWAAYGRNPTTYELYFDGALTTIGYWYANATKERAFNNLNVGEYNVTIKILDVGNKFITTSAIWKVVDTTAPQFIEQQDRILNLGDQTPVKLKWEVYDHSPNTYKILQDGRTITDGNWSNVNPIMFNISTTLSLGIYSYLTVFYDQSGNAAVDQFTITVRDISGPQINGTTEVNLEFGSNGEISWELFDINLDSYEIYVNEVFNTTATLSEENATISIPLIQLPVDTHSYTIIAYDNLGNKQEYTTLVSVRDTQKPVIVSSSESEITLFNQHFMEQKTISVTPYDERPGKYYLTVNQTVRVNGEIWENDQPIFIIIGPIFDIGFESFNLTFVDQGGLVTSLIFHVLHNDLKKPIIIEAEASEFVELGESFSVKLSARDERPGIYIIELRDLSQPVVENETTTAYIENLRGQVERGEAPPSDNSLDDLRILLNVKPENVIDANIWRSFSIMHQTIDNLAVGDYIVNAFYLDRSYNYELRQFNFSVRDTIPVVITTNIQESFNEFDYFESDALEWFLSDSSPESYQFWENGILLKNVSWTSPAKLSYALNNLIPGMQYNFTVQAKDTNGLITSLQTTLQLFDTIPPRIGENFTKTTFNSEEKNNALQWIITEKLPKNYSIYIDGELQKAEILTNFTTSIFLLLDNIAIGEYDVTIVSNDQLNNKNTKLVKIIIEDRSPPEIYIPKEIMIIDGEVSTNNTWKAVDEYPNFYVIKVNDSIIQTGNWSSDELRQLPVEQLDAGEYNLEIIVYDSTGNYKSEFVKVVVIENMQNTGTTLVVIIVPLVLIIAAGIVTYIILSIRRKKRK